MKLPRTVAVVGAGTMGAGIAQRIATAGFGVLLADVDLAHAEAGRERIAGSLARAAERGVLRPAEAAAALARIAAVGDLAGLAPADLAIEAVPEELLLKKELMRALDEACARECVLATNTSSFYVHELASVTRRPGHVVGLHYFYPPARNRLVEVIPGPLTRPEVIEGVEAFAEAHGKTSIRVKDSPGFAVNRYFVPWLNEAVRIVQEGVASIPTVEGAARAAFGIAMGPFELMNATGIAIARHAAATLGTELGPFYEPADLLREQADAGRAWPLLGAADPGAGDGIRRRLFAVVFAVAGAIVDEGVCSPPDVDRGARLGLRWPLGPFGLMLREGAAAAQAMCEELAARHPDLDVPDTVAAGLPNVPEWSGE